MDILAEHIKNKIKTISLILQFYLTSVKHFISSHADNTE